MQIGSKRQHLEWINEYVEKEPENRHLPHLYELFPSNQDLYSNAPNLWLQLSRPGSC
ncbi:glycosyl hydrolase family 95 catalytic domain-containing protein [Flavobacterium sp. FlaQc-48]|uniref:glycosyl hydrolase family 95 catalytic domain-containing protein n=1 Tax=Flavobacterium sp. FlaQc-48 TaxID=3374181 RepID=UPI0037578478